MSTIESIPTIHKVLQRFDGDGLISAGILQALYSDTDRDGRITPTVDGDGEFQKMMTNSQPCACTYNVLLSFRGEDTRTGFTDHLYTALKRAGIRTFRDDDGIKIGENIKAELRKAIQQSSISIIVFSKNFASSRWCLNELLMILERYRTVGHMVLPVFYRVDPSHVRHQSGPFQDAFSRHETGSDKDNVKGWREALRVVTGLKGMVLQENQYEAPFIQEIVKEIEKKLASDKVGIGKKTVCGLSIHRFQTQVGPLIGSATMDAIVTNILHGVESMKLAVRKATHVSTS